MRFSRNMDKIKLSKTAEVSDLALSLKEQGHKIVNMATGELSFKPALSIRKEACRTINKGATLYTQVAGRQELRDLISVKLKKDVGSTEIQIGLLTDKISKLADHFKISKKDKHSSVGLTKSVNKRKKLLAYLKRKNPNSYQKVIKQLNLRK